jgi:hypothetical protein
LEDHELTEKGFNATIFSCIDTALNTLGEASRLALYYQVGSKFHLNSTQFESRPLEVVDCLHKILGDVGYSFIQRLIVREIGRSFKMTLREGISLPEAVFEARKIFLSKNK